MSTQERAPERRREGEAEAAIPAQKPAAPTAPSPVLPPAGAFVTAGVCSAATGYLATTGAAFREMYASLGVELPWMTSLVMEQRVALLVGLLVCAAGLLGLGALRLPPSGAARTARTLASAAAVAACGLAALCIGANVLVFVTIQKALQD